MRSKIVATRHAITRARERAMTVNLALDDHEIKRRLESLWYEALDPEELYLDPDVPELPTRVKRVEPHEGETWLVARVNPKTGETVIVSVLTPEQKLNNSRRRWRPWV